MSGWVCYPGLSSPIITIPENPVGAFSSSMDNIFVYLWSAYSQFLGLQLWQDMKLSPSKSVSCFKSHIKKKWKLYIPGDRFGSPLNTYAWRPLATSWLLLSLFSIIKQLNLASQQICRSPFSSMFLSSSPWYSIAFSESLHPLLNHSWVLIQFFEVKKILDVKC